MSLRKIADEVYETDVVVIGSEAAGSRAAIEASKYDLNVTLITKGRDIGKSGATVAAGRQNDISIDSRSLCELGLEGDRKDTKKIFFEDIVKGGGYINNRKLVQAYVRDIAPRIKELIDWELEYDRRVVHAPGHRYPRGFTTGGFQIIKTLRKEIGRLGNVEVVGDMFVMDILTEGMRVSGVAALNLRTGEFCVYRAKSIVLATGGAHAIYPIRSIPGGKELTGDGQAMAYRAGADLVDCEFVQYTTFNPTSLVWPPTPRWMERGPVTPFLYGHMLGIRLYNRWGERFMKRYDSERMENTTRDIQVFAIASEIMEGRGSKHGGVYCSIKHLPDNLVDYYIELYKERREFYEYLKPIVEQMKKGMALEIGEGGVHFFMGGIKINERCETTLSGLFAAGECAGGLNGANRLQGIALGQTQVQGAIAGRNAAQFALENSFSKIDVDQVQRIRERVYGYIERKQGVRPFVLRKQIQEIARNNVGIVRDMSLLQAAIKDMEVIKKEKLPKLYCEARSSTYNLEWIEALQVVNSIQMLECIARSALMRKETRGSHHRRDYPIADNENWLCNIIVTQVGDEVALTKSRNEMSIESTEVNCFAARSH